jgi:hypothetical protein
MSRQLSNNEKIYGDVPKCPPPLRERIGRGILSRTAPCEVEGKGRGSALLVAAKRSAAAKPGEAPPCSSAGIMKEQVRILILSS